MPECAVESAAGRSVARPHPAGRVAATRGLGVLALPACIVMRRPAPGKRCEEMEGLHLHRRWKKVLTRVLPHRRLSGRMGFSPAADRRDPDLSAGFGGAPERLRRVRRRFRREMHAALPGDLARIGLLTARARGAPAVIRAGHHAALHRQLSHSSAAPSAARRWWAKAASDAPSPQPVRRAPQQRRLEEPIQATPDPPPPGAAARAAGRSILRPLRGAVPVAPTARRRDRGCVHGTVRRVPAAAPRPPASGVRNPEGRGAEVEAPRLTRTPAAGRRPSQREGARSRESTALRCGGGRQRERRGRGARFAARSASRGLSGPPCAGDYHAPGARRPSSPTLPDPQPDRRPPLGLVSRLRLRSRSPTSALCPGRAPHQSRLRVPRHAPLPPRLRRVPRAVLGRPRRLRPSSGSPESSSPPAGPTSASPSPTASSARPAPGGLAGDGGDRRAPLPEGAGCAGASGQG